MKRALPFLILGIIAFLGVIFIKAFTLGSASAPTAAAGGDRIALDENAVAARLAEAVQLQTISHYDPTQVDAAPFTQFTALVEKNYPRVFATLQGEKIADHSLLFTWKGSDERLKPMLLLAHLDVVPIAPGTEGDWTHPPFSGAIADGFVWGRGTIDDKSGVLGILEAAEYLLTQDFQPRRTLIFAFGHDEEVGGPHGAATIAQLLRERGVLPEVILDEGGVVGTGLMADVKAPVAFVGIAEKGFTSVELTTAAAGGHSSMPPKRTAIGALARAIERLENNQMPAKLDGPAREMLTTLAPEMPFGKRLVLANLWLFSPVLKRVLSDAPATNAAIRTTTAPTIFNAGEKDNVLPAKATATVNFRVIPGESEASVLEHIKKVIDDPAIELKATSHGGPSPVADVNGTGYKWLKRVIQRSFADALVSPYLTVGGTDSKHYQSLSTNVFRFLPVRMGPEDMGRMHGTNERIAVKDYADMVRFYIEFARESSRDLAAP